MTEARVSPTAVLYVLFECQPNKTTFPLVTRRQFVWFGEMIRVNLMSRVKHKNVFSKLQKIHQLSALRRNASRCGVLPVVLGLRLRMAAYITLHSAYHYCLPV